MRRNDYIILFLASLYIILLPLAPSLKYEASLIGLFVIISLIYFAELLSNKEDRDRFCNNLRKIFHEPFTYLFIGYVLLMAASSIYSQNKIATLKEAFRFFYYLSIYFIIRLRFNKVKFFAVIINVYLVSVAIVGLIGVYDFMIHYEKWYTADLILGMSRVKSTLPHFNSFGGYLLLAFFPVIVLCFESKGFKRVIYSLLIVLLSFDIVVTFSRNAWLAVLLGTVLLILLYNWKFIFLFFVSAIFAIITPAVLERLKQLFNSQVNDGRIKLWTMSVKIVKEHFFFGVGSGNFITTYKEYAKRFPSLQIAEAEALPPHNSYIKSLTELGIFGIVLFLFMCFEILKKVYYIRDKCSGMVKSFYNGFLISVICFYMMNCFDDMFFSPKIMINFIIFVSIAFAIGGMEKDTEGILMQS